MIFLSPLLLLVTALLLTSAEDDGSYFVPGSPLIYPLPLITMKIVTLTGGLDVIEMQLDVEEQSALHLTNNLLKGLPETGPLGINCFERVNIVSSVESVVAANASDFATQEERTEVTAVLEGNVVFRDHPNALPDDSIVLRRTMLDMLQYAFGDQMEYARLITKFTNTDSLENLKGLLISVDKTDYLKDVLPETVQDNEYNSKRSLTTMGIVIVSLAVIITVSLALCIVVILRVRKPPTRRWKNTRKVATSKASENGDSEEELDNAPPPNEGEEFLDEWAQKITSIPVRKNSGSMAKQRRNTAPRPASRSRKRLSLDCIVEEGSEVESTSGADMSDHDRGTCDAESALGGIHDDDDNDEDDDEDFDFENLGVGMVAV